MSEKGSLKLVPTLPRPTPEAEAKAATAQPEPEQIDLKKGHKGPVVGALKGNLKAWGFDPGTCDDTFDDKTVEAITALQRKLGINPTGIVDASTRRAIKADLESPVASALRATQAAVGLRLAREVKSSELAAAKAEGAAQAQEAPVPAPSPFVSLPFLLLVGFGLFFLLGRKGSGAVGDAGDVGDEDGTSGGTSAETPGVEVISGYGQAHAPAKPKRKPRRKPRQKSVPLAAAEAVIDVTAESAEPEPEPEPVA